jgi:tetratricopeptide (TPR) repeat protein
LRSRALLGSNLLLVTIDTLRADRVGAYGGGHLTPTIDRVAAQGIRFSRARSHVPLTLPAHASILTGLVPATHGLHNNGATGLDPHVPTLAERLQSAGYRTGAFVGAFVLDARFGLNRGFGVYDDRVGADTGPITFAFAERSADQVTKVAGDWILSGSSGLGAGGPAPSPWFAWIHLFDPHAPYRAPEQRALNPYDNEVAFTDGQIGGLLDRLRAAGQLDRTLIVMLADHGEALGDHGEATHGLFAYDATLHIPLIVAGPAIRPQVVDAPVAQADVLPTLLDLLGVALPQQLDGRSLLGPIRGEAGTDRPIYFEALDAYLTRGWAPLTGVIDHGWKYIDLPEPELYDLDRDPGEQHNLAARNPERVAALRRDLGRWNPPSAAFAHAQTAQVDPDVAARLRALGYTASQAPRAARSVYGVNDDPKHLLALDRQYEQALTLTGERRYDEAAALLRMAIAARPDFIVAYTNLASVLIESGRPREAVSVLEEAASHGIATVEIRARLGAAYLASGEPGRASAVLQPLATAGEGGLEVVNTLGIALSQLGHRDDARRLFDQVLQRSPRSATTWNNLGLLEMADRRPREAARAFERAVSADPGFGPAWKALGAIRAQSDPRGAIDAWRRAIALAPDDYDLLFNLAVLLHQQRRDEEARPYVERFVRDAPPARYASDIATLRALLTK